MITVDPKKYWQKRSENTLIENEKSALEYEKLLRESYQTAIANVNKEIQAFYGKYAKNNVISIAEAKQRLNATELKAFNKQQRVYLAAIKRLGDKAFTADYVEYINKLSARAYISKLEELNANIRYQVEVLSANYNNDLGTTLQSSYEESYYKTMYAIQSNVGIGVSFTNPTGKMLETAVKENWNGSNYSGRIWADKNKLIATLNQLIPQEFIRGRSIKAISDDISKQFNTSYSNAERLVRTEINYISNKGSMKSYKDSNVVKEYEYLATLDGRTSDICRDMDGKIFALKDAIIGVNQPPLHPRCRSTTIPYFPDDEISSTIEDRIARDENGQSYKVGKDVTYEEWVNKYASASYAKKVKADPKAYADVF